MWVADHEAKKHMTDVTIPLTTIERDPLTEQVFANVRTTALHERFNSAGKVARKLLSAIGRGFGGHAARWTEGPPATP